MNGGAIVWPIDPRSFILESSMINDHSLRVSRTSRRQTRQEAGITLRRSQRLGTLLSGSSLRHVLAMECGHKTVILRAQRVRHAMAR